MHSVYSNSIHKESTSKVWDFADKRRDSIGCIGLSTGLDHSNYTTAIVFIQNTLRVLLNMKITQLEDLSDPWKENLNRLPFTWDRGPN